MTSINRFKFLKTISILFLTICITLTNFSYAPTQIIHALTGNTLTVAGSNKTENQAFIFKVDGNDAGTLKLDTLNAPSSLTGNEYTFDSVDNKTYNITITAFEGYSFKNLKINNIVHNVEEFSVLDKNTYSYSLSINNSMENIKLIPEFKKNSSQTSARKIIVGDTTCIDETSSNPNLHYSNEKFTVIPASSEGEYIININDSSAIGAVVGEGSPSLIIKSQGSGIIESQNGISIMGIKNLKFIGNNQNTAKDLTLKGGIKCSDEIIFNSNVSIGNQTSRSQCGIKGGASSQDNKLNLTIEYADLNVYTDNNTPSFENIGGNISVGSNGKIQTSSEQKIFNNIAGHISVKDGGKITSTFKDNSLPSNIYSKWTDWQDKIWSSASPAPELEEQVKWEQITTEEQANNHYTCSKSSEADKSGYYSWSLSSSDHPLYTLIYGKGKNGEANELVKGTISFLNGVGQCVSESTSENYGEYKFPASSSITVKLLPQYGYQLNKSAVEAISTTPQAEKGTYSFTMPKKNIYLSELFTSSSDQLIINSGEILNAKIIPYSNLINGNLKFTISSAPTPSNASSFENAAKDYEISNYFNLVLDEIILKSGDSSQTPWESELNELNTPIGITIELAEALKGKKRYCVLREHNGEITNLKNTYNSKSNEIEFLSDKFSNYAIGYSNIVRTLSTNLDYDGEKLNIIIEDPNNALSDDAELVVTLVKPGTERYNELKNNLDNTHKIENLIFFDIFIYKDSTHTEMYSQLNDKVNVFFQIPTGWDKKDLQAVLVAEGVDGEFDEELTSKDDVEYLSFWTDHFSPYAFLDELSDEELENLSKLTEPIEEKNSPQNDFVNFVTGDQSRTIILIAVSAGIVSLAVLLILKKKENK